MAIYKTTYKLYNGSSWDEYRFVPAPHSHSINDLTVDNTTVPYLTTYCDKIPVYNAEFNSSSSAYITNILKGISDVANLDTLPYIGYIGFESVLTNTNYGSTDPRYYNKITQFGTNAYGLSFKSLYSPSSSGAYYSIFEVKEKQLSFKYAKSRLVGALGPSSSIPQDVTNTVSAFKVIADNASMSALNHTQVAGALEIQSVLDAPLSTTYKYVPYFGIFSQVGVAYNVTTSQNNVSIGPTEGNVTFYLGSVLPSTSANQTSHVIPIEFKRGTYDKRTTHYILFEEQVYSLINSNTNNLQNQINTLKNGKQDSINLIRLDRQTVDGIISLTLGGFITLSNGYTLTVTIATDDDPILLFPDEDESPSVPQDWSYAFIFLITDENDDPVIAQSVSFVEKEDHSAFATTPMSGSQSCDYIENCDLDDLINGDSDNACLVIYYTNDPDVDYNEYPFYDYDENNDEHYNTDDTAHYNKIVLTVDVANGVFIVEEQ